MMKNLFANIKARITAKPFDIWTECICKNRKNDRYWLASDGLIYYGSRWGVFLISYQNSWYQKQKMTNK
jgi:hypothetical protein